MTLVQYMLILAIIIISGGFPFTLWIQSLFFNLYKKRELLLFKEIDLNINNDFKELFYKNKKINYQTLTFLSILLYFLFYLGMMVISCWALSETFSTTTTKILIYLIPILIYSILATITTWLFFRKNLAKHKEPLSKDFETIESYFKKLKSVEAASDYDFKLINHKSRSLNMIINANKRFLKRKINKLKSKKVDDNFIVLFLLSLLSRYGIPKLKIMKVQMYKNGQIIENISSYELFFLKYVLAKVTKKN